MLKEKISQLIDDKGFNLEVISQTLNISKSEALSNLPNDVATVTSADHFDEIFENITTWGEVLVVKVTPSFIMEIKTPISKGSYARGYYNLSAKNAPLGGHLKTDDIEYIVFISAKIVMGMLSHAVCFFDKQGDEIVKIYVARDEKRQFIKEQELAYLNLKNKYAQ